MYAVVGTLFLALGVLVFSIVMLASRKPNPPAWTTYTLTHEVVAIGSVSLGGFGIAFVAESAASLKQQPLTTIHFMLIASILVVFAFVWMRLKVRKTLAEYAKQTEGASRASGTTSRPAFAGEIVATPSQPGASTPEGPSSPTRPRTPRWRKKAA